MNKSNHPALSAARVAAIVITALTAACGGGGGGDSSSTTGGSGNSQPATYSVGGNITGLSASGLVLLNNGSDSSSQQSGASTFTFPTKVADGAQYSVTVSAQPSNETCTVANGTGTVGTANVSNVAVTCTVNSAPAQTIGGTISGLTASGLTLEDNGGDNLPVPSGAASFTFATKVADGSTYAVTVGTQPTNQTCTVSQGSGTVGTSNIANVSISCSANTQTVGGMISGLTVAGLILKDNGGDNLAVPANATTFTFATPVADGNPYAVAIAAQPTTETCQVAANGSGTVGSTNVTNVSITCAINQYSVGGTVTGLSGATGLVLSDNNTDTLTVMPPAGGGAEAFKFTNTVPSGGAYKVTIKTQPANQAQVCTVTSGGSGNITTGDITNVAINCVNVGRFVFVTNQSDGANGDVSAFTINQTTGALTAATGSPFLADKAPSNVAVDTTGQFVYVSNKSSLDVTAFYLDPNTGILTLKASYFSTHTVPLSIAITPTDNYLFASGGGVDMPGAIFSFTLNNQSGQLFGVTGSKIDLTSAAPSSAIDPTGQYLFVPVPSHFIWVFSIGAGGLLNPTDQTGNGPFGTVPNEPYGIAVWPGGTAAGGFLYVSSRTAGAVGVFSYDSTGTLTHLKTVDAGLGTRGVAIDPAGTYLYAANYTDGTISAYSINAQTGALTAVGPDVATGNLNSVASPGPSNLMWDPSGQWLYCTNTLDGSISVFTANLGVLTLVGSVDTVQTNPTGASPLGIAVY